MNRRQKLEELLVLMEKMENPNRTIEDIFNFTQAGRQFLLWQIDITEEESLKVRKLEKERGFKIPKTDWISWRAIEEASKY